MLLSSLCTARGPGRGARKDAASNAGAWSNGASGRSMPASRLWFGLSALLVFSAACQAADFASSAEAKAAAAAAAARCSGARGALTGAAEELAAAQRRYSELESSGPDQRDLRREAARLAGQIQRLRLEENEAIYELRQGLYCSQCMRSKSEIERGGENFYAHLQRVQGHVVAATPEQVDQKAREYDDKIGELNGQYQSLELQMAARVQQHKQRLAAALLAVAQQRSHYAQLQSQSALACYEYANDMQDAAVLESRERALAQAEEERRRRELARRRLEEKRSAQLAARAQAAAEASARRAMAQAAPPPEMPASSDSASDRSALPQPSGNPPDSDTPSPTVRPPALVTEHRQPAPDPEELAHEWAEMRDSARQAVFANSATDAAAGSASMLEELSNDLAPPAQGSWAERTAVALARARELAAGALQNWKREAESSIPDRALDEALAYGPPTIPERVQRQVKGALDDLVESAAGPRMASLAEPVTQALAERATTALQERVARTVDETMLRLGKRTEPADEASRLQSEFEAAASPTKLLLQTWPAQGGRAIAGLKAYQGELLDKFIRYFGFAAQQIQSDGAGANE